MKKTAKLIIVFIPILVSCILGAAHFFRLGYLPVAFLCLLFPLLLLWKDHRVILIFKIVLFLLAAEWLRTAYTLINQRIMMGAPYYRLAIILFLVSLSTALSSFVFHLKFLKKSYYLKS